MKKLWALLGVTFCLLTTHILAAQSCDMSAFTGAPFTLYFSESLSYSTTTFLDDGTVQTDNYQETAQGQATMSFLNNYAWTFGSAWHRLDPWDVNFPGTPGYYDFIGVPVGTGTIQDSLNGTVQGAFDPFAEVTLWTDALHCRAWVDLDYQINGTPAASSDAEFSQVPGFFINPYISYPTNFFTSSQISGTEANTLGCPYGGYNCKFSLSWSTSPASASITITSMKITQGQPPDDGSTAGKVPLVLNRPAAVQIKGTGSGPTTIDVKINVGGQTYDNPNVSVADLTKVGGNGAFVPFTPTGLPLQTATTLTLSSSTSGVNITAAPINIEAFKSGPTNYLYVNVLDGSYTLPNDNFINMVQASDFYLDAVFPLDPTTYKRSTSTYGPTQASSYPWLYPAWSVLSDMTTLADLLGVDRIIGIVTQHWMTNVVSSKNPNGYSVPLLFPSAVIVQYGFPETSAHELGHTYGLYGKLTTPELYNSYPGCPTGSPDTTAPLAYFVQEMEFLGTNVWNYMCAGGNSDPFFTGGDPLFWTTSQDWLTVGKKLTATSFDPEVVIISGYVDNTGKGGFGGLYRNITGTADAGPGGAYALQVLDSSGAVLSSITFDPVFTPNDVPDLTSPYSPFVFKLAYPSNAASTRITKGTAVLASENIAGSLLLRAVQNLQDAAFVANPTQYRTALLNMVNAFNQQLATGNVTGAQQFLTNGIEPQISSWLSNSYVAPNPLFYTKASLLSLVNELAQRLALAQ